MPRRTVLVMGFDGLPPLGSDMPWRAVRNSFLRTELSRCPHGAVLLLGDAVLRDGASVGILAIARRHSCIVVACPHSLPVSYLVPWVRAGATHIEDSRHVGSVVLDLIHVPVLPDVQRNAWLPRVPRPGTLAAIFVASIPARFPPHLDSHLTALGVKRQVLRKETLREIGANPSDLLHDFTRAKIRACRRCGLRIGTIASGLSLDRGTVRRYLATGDSVGPRPKPDPRRGR